MAVLIDTPDGAAIRARSRRPSPHRTTIRDVYEDVPLSTFPSADSEGRASSWGSAPHVNIGCPKHSWMAVTADYLRELEAEYRLDGKVVVRVLAHPPQRTT
jgi:hypothetical protein